MSYNGSGTFNINTAGQPVVDGTVISSSVFNALTADLGTGLTTAITKDGQTTPTANIPLGTFKITGLGAGTAATDAVRMSQLQAGGTTFLTAAGTDTITATATPSLTAYATGNLFTFVVANTNTGAVTLNIDGLGAKAVTRDGTTALGANDLLATEVVIVGYDGTRFQVLNPNALGTPASGVLTNTTGLPPGGVSFTTTDVLLGRSTAGAGVGEEITCTPFARTVLDDTTAAAARETLGVAASGLVCDFRLTLTTAVPVTTADVTGATTIYCAPYKGNQIALYDGSTAWNVRTSAEFSLALGTLTAALPYDVFCYDNATVPTLEFTAWTNATTRATALTTQDGVYVRSGATTRRYLGTFYTTATTTTADSVAQRYLWNYYNRAARAMRAVDTTDNWTYTTATWRQANASTANQLAFVLGVAEDMVSADVYGSGYNSGAAGAVAFGVGVGLDATNALASGCISPPTVNIATFTQQQLVAAWKGFPSAGSHYLAWLERSTAANTTTWFGDNGAVGLQQSGIHGEVLA